VVAGGSDDGDAVADAHATDAHGAEAHGADPEFEPTVQFGEPPRTSRLHGHDPHESPVLMLVPLLALAFLSVVGGLLDLPIGNLNFLTQFLEPVFRGVSEPSVSAGEQVGVEGISVLFATVGLYIGYRLYRRGLRSAAEDPLVDGLQPAGNVLGHAYYYDEGLGRFVGGPGRRSASWLDRVFDQKIIDGAVNGVGKLAQLASRGLSKVQDGFVRRYALALLLGTVAIVLFLLLWAGR
jgi:NADH-quinone oxidoreductase subunit L